MPSRLESVDVLRGITIAGMIVVNDPGTWSAVYPQLLHAEWNGWTYTDTIFPFFLFVAGVSMALSFGRRRAEGASAAALLRHTAVRAATLVAIGLALNLAGFLAFHREHLRIPGVLQRIGLCVLAAGAIRLLGGTRAAAWSAVALLVGTGSFCRPALSTRKETSRRESTGPSSAPTPGSRAGIPRASSRHSPQSPRRSSVCSRESASARTPPSSRKAAELLAAGSAAAAAGLAWGLVFPINKSLWTSSYALLMSGLACASLAVCMVLVDLKGWRRWAAPFLWLGRNAIAAFTLSTLGAIALIAVHVPGPDGKPRSLWTAVYRTVFDRFADPRLGSLLFALAWLGLWVAVFGVLYRKRIFLKI